MTEFTLSRRASLRNMAALGAVGAAVALGATSIAVGSADAAQPLMADALRDLQAARATLARAARDKAGHRVKAIGLIDEAIAQVKAGMVAGAM